MSWNNHDIKFIRPIRKLIILLDKKLIQYKIHGVCSKKNLYGNIFTNFKKIKIQHAQEYEKLLYKYGKVIAQFNTRKKK